MDAMALEDNTEAAVSADANDAEADKVIQQFLTGMYVISQASPRLGMIYPMCLAPVFFYWSSLYCCLLFRGLTGGQ